MSEENFREINVDAIDRNPENPRILFRPNEMSQLMESIRRHGVQVPISVFREGKRFVLIDGERRWRCSIKLNRKTIPALIQDKPDQLTNLLLMFNIHALREQWDLLTIAVKLPRVIELLENNLGRQPTEKEISAETGLILGLLRRCKLLMALPDKYKRVILNELQKPKPQQKLTEDFFIEMERALKTVERSMPNLVKKLGKESMREILISKYKNGTISNRVDFRQVAKIARAERVGVDRHVAEQSLDHLFNHEHYTIERAFQESVGFAYDERDLLTRVCGLTSYIQHFEQSEIDKEIRKALEELRNEIDKLLEEE
ncbi:MAG: ParB/RepB/Spo0J family partition protein [Deltaproteobacteria bacterium]|nr:ParB/RepB/Spo0J family partition protein [Deltaproteobacteria bacterium]